MKFLCMMILAAMSTTMVQAIGLEEQLSTSIFLKTPGNEAIEYPLHSVGQCGERVYLEGETSLPLIITRQITKENDVTSITVTLTALKDVYFNLSLQLSTFFTHNDCLFYMPGFWYRKNLRSPKEAPSFYTSDSWQVREDRLSAPLTGIYHESDGYYVTICRRSAFGKETLTTHKEGEVILSGDTSIGFTGFKNTNGKASLVFGFPYSEAPKTYVRKLTLAPAVQAFEKLDTGKTISLRWDFTEGFVDDFSTFIQHTWEYCYDTYKPTPIADTYSVETMKETLSNYFVESFVEEYPLCFFSSAEMSVATCQSVANTEIGFIGRTLLNAFNAWEYGHQQDRADLKDIGAKIFNSYLVNGFHDSGLMREMVDYRDGPEVEVDPTLSIRRQSEGLYAMLLYLDYEKRQGNKHPQWEEKLRGMLEVFLKVQQEDGSFPRKFKNDFSIVDGSGGSTPSATVPLVMGYKYFKDKRYLEAAKRTADYLEREVISKADYFSSTLDAYCEDKEASFYAVIATYYLCLVTKGEEHQHYADLCKTAAYFALSWYYLWDVPFAHGQLLGELGLRTRGWGNVSVENNHIDVFVFELADALRWLGNKYGEERFPAMAQVISSSMRQLLPREEYLCGIGKAGFYPEVVQHTNWDYGNNGKGFYNDIFAPGWTVASLWTLITPCRAENFLTGK